MVTVELSELELNQVTAALSDRMTKLTRQAMALRGQESTNDQRFASEVTNLAITQTMRAQFAIAEAVGVPDFPPSMTVEKLDDWAPGELGEAFGK